MNANSRFPKGIKFFLLYVIAIIVWFGLFILGSSILKDIFDTPSTAQAFWGIISFIGIGFGTGYATVEILDGDL